LQINGVGGMEIAEVRGFVVGVVDGLRYVCFCRLYLPALLVCWYAGLTLRLAGKSGVRERKLDENVKLTNGRMGLGAVPTRTMMTTTTCNYNVHFPFSVSDLLPPFYAYNVMSRLIMSGKFRASNLRRLADLGPQVYQFRCAPSMHSEQPLCDLIVPSPRGKLQSQASLLRHTS
jgi:hypothetical protein